MVSSMGWERLLSVGRYLYANLAAVHSAVNEKATYTVGSGWLPRYMGRDKAFGEAAEAWLTEQWFPRCNQRGPLYDFRTELWLTSVGIDRDGDRLMVKTYSQDGAWPLVLFIPTHQIGSRYNQQTIEKGRYKNLPVKRGVIFNRRGRAVAYNILGAARDGSEDWQVSARESRLVFEPEWSEQARGVTALANAIRDWTDFRDIRDFEKVGIKTASAVMLMEDNMTGSADTDDDPYTTPSGTDTGLTFEDIDPAVRYFRANSGAGLRAFESHRPSQNTAAFLTDQVMRNAFAGLGWPIEFAWDASKIGGAVARMIVAKAERTVAGRQTRMSPMALDAIRYAIAYQIDRGELPPDPDWYLWDVQMPRMLTVDAGYESEADIEEYKMGFTTLSEIYGRRGQDWRAQIQQRIAERRYLVEELAGTGIAPDDIVGGPKSPPRPVNTPQPSEPDQA